MLDNLSSGLLTLGGALVGMIVPHLLQVNTDKRKRAQERRDALGKMLAEALMLTEPAELKDYPTAKTKLMYLQLHLGNSKGKEERDLAFRLRELANEVKNHQSWREGRFENFKEEVYLEVWLDARDAGSCLFAP
jgi:hypothetical protein